MALPSVAEVTNLGLDTSLSAIALWAGVEPACSTAWAAAIGSRDFAAAHPRAAANITAAEMEEAIVAIRIPGPVRAEEEEPSAPVAPPILQRSLLRAM